MHADRPGLLQLGHFDLLLLLLPRPSQLIVVSLVFLTSLRHAPGPIAKAAVIAALPPLHLWLASRLLLGLLFLMLLLLVCYSSGSSFSLGCISSLSSFDLDSGFSLGNSYLLCD